MRWAVGSISKSRRRGRSFCHAALIDCVVEMAGRASGLLLLAALLAATMQPHVVSATTITTSITVTLAALQGNWSGVCTQFAAIDVSTHSTNTTCLPYKAPTIGYHFNATYRGSNLTYSGSDPKITTYLGTNYSWLPYHVSATVQSLSPIKNSTAVTVQAILSDAALFKYQATLTSVAGVKTYTQAGTLYITTNSLTNNAPSNALVPNAITSLSCSKAQYTYMCVSTLV